MQATIKCGFFILNEINEICHKRKIQKEYNFHDD